jgi:hypothetical protein
MSEKKQVDQRPDARRRSVTDGKIVFTGATVIKRRISIRPIVPIGASRRRRFSLR